MQTLLLQPAALAAVAEVAGFHPTVAVVPSAKETTDLYPPPGCSVFVTTVPESIGAEDEGVALADCSVLGSIDEFDVDAPHPASKMAAAAGTNAARADTERERCS